MDTVEVMHLVAAAQQGAADEVRRATEARMAEIGGSVEAGPAGLHFVRAVAFYAVNDYRAALAASNLMLAAADRERDAGWRSIALSFRAGQHIVLGEKELAEYNVDTVLRDLVASEAALAEVHLQWALELYRIGEIDDAEKHSVTAESHALQVGRHATASTTYWRDVAGLYAGCARADGDDPAGAAAQIRRYADRIRACERMDVWLFGMPFLAVALHRSGHHGDALAVVEEALTHLPEHGDWLSAAALTHTHAVLLATTGSPAARASLRYGDELAAALWRQRQRTLHTAETLRSYEQLRVEHEQVSRSAETDALTGVANRRAFDHALARHADGAGGGLTAVLVIDLDKFKPLNDTFGHAAGDHALQTVAAILARHIRGGDLLARTGGDEFCALLADSDTADAAQVGERIVHAVRELNLGVTLSVGVAAGPGMAVRNTVERADRAMYAAKTAGGDRTRTSPVT
jgi:diguanylate cyclase (GGDEF)-like protein